MKRMKRSSAFYALCLFLGLLVLMVAPVALGDLFDTESSMRPLAVTTAEAWSFGATAAVAFFVIWALAAFATRHRRRRREP